MRPWSLAVWCAVCAACTADNPLFGLGGGDQGTTALVTSSSGIASTGAEAEATSGTTEVRDECSFPLVPEFTTNLAATECDGTRTLIGRATAGAGLVVTSCGDCVCDMPGAEVSIEIAGLPVSLPTVAVDTCVRIVVERSASCRVTGFAIESSRLNGWDLDFLVVQDVDTLPFAQSLPAAKVVGFELERGPCDCGGCCAEDVGEYRFDFDGVEVKVDESRPVEAFFQQPMVVDNFASHRDTDCETAKLWAAVRSGP